MIETLKSKQFLAFILAGGFAAAVNFSSRFLYNQFTSYSVAIILAYITGMVTAFVLTKLFVFEQSKHSSAKEFFYFTLVNVVAVMQTYAISVFLAWYVFPRLGFTYYPEAAAHGVGVVVPVFTSFFGHKFLTFRALVKEKG